MKLTTIQEAVSAEDAFSQHYKEIGEKLRTVATSCANLKKEFSQEPNNRDWGFVGSIGHVNKTLDDLIEFLTS